MIVESILNGVARARASVTFNNINISQEFEGSLGMRPSVSVELVGGRLALYEQLYRGQPWAHSAVNRIARGTGRLPLQLFRDATKPGARERIREGTLYDLIRRPWWTGLGGAIQPGTMPLLVQSVMVPTLVHGWNIMVKLYQDEDGRRTNEPTALMPSLPYCWRPVWEYPQNAGTPNRPEDAQLAGWYYRSWRGEGFFLPSEIWVFAPWGIGRGGIPASPFEALRTTLVSEDAIQRAIIQRFEQGARPAGFISFPGEVKNLADLRKQIDAEYGGVDNFYKMGLLDNNATWQDIGGSFVDAELSQLRMLNREECATVFNLPHTSLGITAKGSPPAASIVEQHLMEYMDTDQPWTDLFEHSFQSQVVDTEPAWKGVYAEFNYREVLKGDPRLEMETLVKATGGPVVTSNEGRAALNYPPLDGGDELREPQNMAVGAQDPQGNTVDTGGRPPSR